MNIRCVAGDISDVAPDEAEASLMWEPVFFCQGPWEHLCQKCPDLIPLEGDARVERPWEADIDTLWEISPPLGQLRYLLVFTNPRGHFGCLGLEEMGNVLSRGLDRVSSLGVRRVAIHIPVYEPALPNRRMENKKCVESMTSILRNWEEGHPGQIEELLLVDKAFHFLSSLDIVRPAESKEPGSFLHGNDSRPIALSIHGSWMLESSIAELAEEPGEWKAAALKAATRLRDWAERVDPNYLNSAIESMDALIRDNEGAGITDDAENRQCAVPRVQRCGLSSGNDTEFPFPLSVAGAWVLLCGIKIYAQQTRDWYALEMDEACYCILRAGTVLKEAEKLRLWAKGVEDDGKVLVRSVERLIQMLVTDRDQFKSLAAEESRRDREEATVEKS